jgi:hypothetical protein
MSKDYDNTNRGSIWKNDKKETDNHPDFTGSLNVDGTEYWVSAWKRKPDASEKAPALSFSVKPKDAQGGGTSAPRANQRRPAGDDPFPDEDIPF